MPSPEPRHRLRVAAAAGAAVALAAWQLSFARVTGPLDPTYLQTGSLGLCPDMRRFFPFFYHFDAFPVGTRLSDPPPATKAGLAALVQTHPEMLVMDFSEPCNTVRYGDYGKILLFLPDALASGKVSPPSVRLFNVLFFLTALEATLLALWREAYPGLAVLLVILVGSDPFQLFEVYTRDNVFSLPISTALLTLALHARFLTGRASIDRAAWAIAAVSGIVLASLREVRTEPALMIVALPFVYLGIARAGLARKLALVLILGAAYAFTGFAWRAYFDRKFEDTKMFVEKAGGVPYTGPRSRYHSVWHNLFIGLGDFDDRLGYRWDDRAAYAYATPIMRARDGLAVTWDGEAYYFEQSYDRRGLYKVSPLDFPEYYEILRAKVVGDGVGHPWWYLRILAKRVAAIMSGTTPPSLAWGKWRIGVPFSGWFVVPTLVAVVLRRRRFLTNLLWFTFPLSLTPLLIFSGSGTTYYAVFHLLTLAVWGEGVLELVGLRACRTGD